jgi:hypothetical protein
VTRRPKVLRWPDGTPKDDDRCAATITAKDPLTLFADGLERPCLRPRRRGYQYCWQHLDARIPIGTYTNE